MYAFACANDIINFHSTISLNFVATSQDCSGNFVDTGVLLSVKRIYRFSCLDEINIKHYQYNIAISYCQCLFIM